MRRQAYEGIMGDSVSSSSMLSPVKQILTDHMTVWVVAFA